MVYIIIIHDVDKIWPFQSLEQTSLEELLNTQQSNSMPLEIRIYETVKTFKKFLSSENFLWHRMFITFIFPVFNKLSLIC